jgi:hypothetical protein
MTGSENVRARKTTPEREPPKLWSSMIELNSVVGDHQQAALTLDLPNLDLVVPSFTFIDKDCFRVNTKKKSLQISRPSTQSIFKKAAASICCRF